MTSTQSIERALIAQQKMISNLIFKWAKDLNTHSSKKRNKLANKHVKRCSKTSAIRITMSYQFTTTRMTVIIRRKN